MTATDPQLSTPLARPSQIISASPARASPILSCESGRLRGRKDADGSYHWLAIPFAAPPLGALRYGPPRPAPFWDGLRDATGFATSLALDGPPTALVLDIHAPNSPAPPANDGAGNRLPVMIWLDDPDTAPRPAEDMAIMALGNGVIAVRLRPRTGATGHLDHSALPDAAGRAASNLWLRDLGTGLAWVQRNIAGFGGDAGNVTLIGAGHAATAVICLMASRIGRGLFHAAIALHPQPDAVLTKAQARQVMQAYLGHLGLPDAKLDGVLALPDIKLAQAFAALPADLQRHHPGHSARDPVIDGDLLTDLPRKILAHGSNDPVPLLLISGPMATRLDGEALLYRQTPFAGDAIRASYPADDGNRMAQDATTLIPSLRLAEAIWPRSQVHLGRIDAPLAVDATAAAGLFLGSWRKAMPALPPPEERRLSAISRILRSACVEFAKTRKPWLAEDLHWPCYDATRRAVMRIDHRPEVLHDPYEKQRRAWG